MGLGWMGRGTQAQGKSPPQLSTTRGQAQTPWMQVSPFPTTKERWGEWASSCPPKSLGALLWAGRCRRVLDSQLCPQCHLGHQMPGGCWGRCFAAWQKQGGTCAMGTASLGWLRGAPSPLCQQAVRSQDCSGANHAIFCLSPARNSLFLTQLGCSCVCRLLLWCSGQGRRTAESPPARQSSPAWGEGPQLDPATEYGAL